MAKKILSVVLKIIVICIVYLLQLYVVNNVKIIGVVANIPLILVSTICLSENKLPAYCYATVCGLLSDVLFSNVICKYLLIYVFVTTILVSLKNTYKQDNKFSVMLYAVTATGICEVLNLLFNAFYTKQVINIFVFLITILKLAIVNLLFAYIIYALWKKCIGKLEI